MKAMHYIAATALLLAGLMTCTAAHATPIVVGSGWNNFNWEGGVGSTSDTFTFTASGPTVLKITDAYLDGDRFAVYDNGTLLDDTSVGVDNGASTSDADTAYSDPRWSSGLFDLGAGSHSLLFDTIAICTGCESGGGGYFRIDATTSVPEPGTLGLFGMGFAGLVAVGLMRRKSRGDIMRTTIA